MCHGYEWEILKAMQAEQIARRNREKAEAQKRQEAKVAPPKPAEPAPRSRDKEPVPA
jgi:hypothetical protein